MRKLIGLLKFTLPLCLFIIGAPSINAQTPTIRFERISLEQGLSHGTVFSIVQDQTGFMWFGTQSGLDKFDGYDITIFRHDPTDPNSISNDNAGNLYLDRAGIIWIGTWGGGLIRLDPHTEQFTAYTHDPVDPRSLSINRVQTIFEDSRGVLWVGTSGGGLNKFDRQTETFTRYRTNPNEANSLSHDRIWRIVEDRAGMLWIATSDGLNKFDPQTETFTHYKNDPANPASLTDNLVRTLYIDKSDTLWVGTETGLDKFNAATETFSHYKNDPADPDSLSDNIINAIMEDRAGNLWVGTSQGGLNKFDRQHQTFSDYTNDPLDPSSLSNNDVRWILEDRSGVIWVATRGGGVNKFVPNLTHFVYMEHNPYLPNTLSHNDVRAIYEDRVQNLWIGTKGGGLNKFDPLTGLFTVYQHDPNNPNSLSSNDVRAIYEDFAGQIWLGLSGGGLNKLDPYTETITRYQHDPEDPTSLSNDDVNIIYEDPPGTLWIGTKGGGLNRFNLETEQFTRYQSASGVPNSLANDDVYDILRDRQSEQLWVGTYGGGLNRFDPDTEQFIRYEYDPEDPASLSNNDIYAIHQEPSGILWIGTNNGLNKFDPETREFTRFGEADGLNSQVIYGILEDQAGNLWLSTVKGLSKFKRPADSFISYDASDGLESIGFTEGAYHKGRSGEIFFGGINGLLRFYPDQIKENPHPPPTVLTALTRPNQEPLRYPFFNRNSTVQLSYEEDVFTFEFTALDYTNPAKNRYAYKLEGFDQSWNFVGNRRFATYTNLDPGRYIFRVKGSNNAGVWNEEGSSIKVTITPPFWETWWFRIAAAAAGLGLAFTVYTVRVTTIKAQRERLKTQVAERTAELSQAYRELQSLTERLQNELVLAREIEKSLLPPPHPPWPNLNVLCYSTPAREVGGDFYAYHAFNSVTMASSGQGQAISSIPSGGRERYAVAVGDASGKGMPAALLMAVSLASFQSAIDLALDPAELLAHLDEIIKPYTRTGRQNCAFCYTEIIPAAPGSNHAATLRVANAGCVPPLIRRKEGQVAWVDIGGMPLGVGLGAEDGYTEASVPLYAGDLLILTSDGVIEATTANGELFGFERLEQTVAAGPATAGAMNHHLQAAVNSFTGGAEPHDDLTIVIVQV